MLPSPCLWGAYSHIRKSYFLVKWHHVVLTGQAQPDSGKQGAAGAQPVQGVVTTAASSSLNWRGWGPCRAQLGSCKQHPWDPPVLRHLQREGLQSQQAAPSTLGSLTGLFFFSRVSFYSRSPHTTLEAVPTGTSWVPYPLIKVLTAWRCPLRSFPKAALQEGAGETSVFTAPGQSTTLLPSEGCKQGAQATQAPWKAVSTGMRSVVDPWRRGQEGQILKLLFPESVQVLFLLSISHANGMVILTDCWGAGSLISCVQTPTRVLKRLGPLHLFPSSPS